MKKRIITKLLLAGAFTALSIGAYAQEEVINAMEEPEKDSITILQEQIDANASGIKKLQKLKVSGYIQTQAEFGQYDQDAKTGASTKTGSTTKYSSAIDGKDASLFHRHGIRRGRIKFEYSESIGKGVFQLDITEGGVKFKDAYFQLNFPCKAVPALNKVISLKAGIFDRPFGDEITYSSSRRESPERADLFQKLFPDERDLGGMLTIKAPKGSAIDGLKLDAGLFSGNGIVKDDNNKLDFIGHLKYDKKMDNMSFGLGASLYQGTTNNADTILYNIKNSKWESEKVDANQTNMRQYIGFDGQFTIETVMGLTNLRAEYLFGSQPSIKDDLGSPKGNSYDLAKPFNYIRKFSGFHAYLIQDIYKTPLALVLKYTSYDPNTEISGNDIKNKGDIAYSTFGIGGLWRITSAVRLQAYYEMRSNEKTDKIVAYKNNIKDNLFTLRLQYKF